MTNACVERIVDNETGEQLVELVNHWDDLVDESDFGLLNSFDGSDESLKTSTSQATLFVKGYLLLTFNVNSICSIMVHSSDVNAYFVRSGSDRSVHRAQTADC
jgi:hypothetical protein